MAKNSFKLRIPDYYVNSIDIFATINGKYTKKDIEEICDEVEFQTNEFLNLFQEQRNSN